MSHDIHVFHFSNTDLGPFVKYELCLHKNEYIFNTESNETLGDLLREQLEEIPDSSGTRYVLGDKYDISHQPTGGTPVPSLDNLVGTFE